MSGAITPALISAIAESIGVPELSAKAASVLAPDVEYRVRDILQVCSRLSWPGCRHECPIASAAPFRLRALRRPEPDSCEPYTNEKQACEMLHENTHSRCSGQRSHVPYT